MTAFTDDVEAVVLTTGKAACKYWVPIPVTGQGSRRNFTEICIRKRGCHLQSSVSHSPSSFNGMMAGPHLDRSVEGQRMTCAQADNFKGH